MKVKKSLALILTCALAATALASCGGSSNNSSSSSKAEESSSASSSEARESSSESSTPEVTAETVDGEENLQTYPLTDSPVTLRYWYPNAGSMAELGDFNDSYFFKWYEEKTGVHIDFVVPAAGSEAESFQLLFA